MCTQARREGQEAGSLKMNTALEYSTRVVQEGDRRCKKSTLNDLVHLTPLRIPLMNPPRVIQTIAGGGGRGGAGGGEDATIHPSFYLSISLFQDVSVF